MSWCVAYLRQLDLPKSDRTAILSDSSRPVTSTYGLRATFVIRVYHRLNGMMASLHHDPRQGLGFRQTNQNAPYAIKRLRMPLQLQSRIRKLGLLTYLSLVELGEERLI